MHEIQAHLDSVNEGTILLEALKDPEMKNEMKKFDADGDGILKLREILMAFKISQDRAQILKYSLAGLVLALIVTYVAWRPRLLCYPINKGKLDCFLWNNAGERD